jgi:hypothetical protein
MPGLLGLPPTKRKKTTKALHYVKTVDKPDSLYDIAAEEFIIASLD